MNTTRSSVKISSEAKNNLRILAKRNAKSEVDYLSKSINFIYKTGIDIYANSSPNVTDLMKNLEKRIIGFMKKREQDFFIPLNKNLQALNQNHIKLFDSLETFDVLKFATEQEEKKKDNIPLKVSDVKDKNTEKIEGISTEIKEENSIKTVDQFDSIKNDNDLLLGKLNKAEKQRDLFKSELVFLAERITKSGALSGGKFTANINQRDYDRIQKIINDN